jgi:hypothetical protein
MEGGYMNLKTLFYSSIWIIAATGGLAVASDVLTQAQSDIAPRLANFSGDMAKRKVAMNDAQFQQMMVNVRLDAIAKKVSEEVFPHYTVQNELLAFVSLKPLSANDFSPQQDGSYLAVRSVLRRDDANASVETLTPVLLTIMVAPGDLVNGTFQSYAEPSGSPVYKPVHPARDRVGGML